MKKSLLVLFTVFFALTAVFAGAEKEIAPVEKVALGSTPVTITFWHSASDDAGLLVDKYIKEFNANNEYQITVNAIYQGQYSDATTLMKTILSAENYKELPDIMQLDATGKLDYYNSGKAFTIDNAVKYFDDDIVDDYLAGALGNWQFSGAQLGLPFATSTTITYYNKDALKAAGWDKGPDTFADIIQLNKDMKAKGVNMATYGAVPNTPTLANWLGQLGSYVVNNSNGADATATKLECIENGALKTFLTEWKAMYDAGALKNESLSTNQFVAGEVAVFTGSSSTVNSLLSKVGGKFEVGATTFLRVNSSANHGATVSGSCLVLFDSEDALKKAAAWEFIKYMTGEEVQADFAAGTGYTPGYKAAVDNVNYKNLLATTPQFSVAPGQLAKTPASMRSVTVGPTVDFYYAIQNEITAMLKDNLTVDATVKSMEKSLQGLLDNYLRMNP
ncbi:MAG: extracellular solute-binding protein [Sphaerochaetaceae bacterium]|jgi:sn-glycerol 3-phosphate transport system substrate-binding protein|nr:extracellular solute-binding protein [Sphaerochaetaceae bacterium]MDD3670872.1 extracellular solute-binding protein [Sphaerochaetaceae bacterium]MDD4260290.1 extracellular solute-binding protein [Sphaerochaetaceae bacterium]MDD4842351.1 extracellular solute-binding protein [Sphaerochaetaceae bacterium]NLO60561.1 extracellular solute-binding protein [Spirochaetales bacterium]